MKNPGAAIRRAARYGQVAANIAGNIVGAGQMADPASFQEYWRRYWNDIAKPGGKYSNPNKFGRPPKPQGNIVIW